MRIIICVLFFILLLSQFCFPQKNNHKGYCGFNLGICFPMGDFGSTDLNNESAGFAHTGFSFSVPAAYLLEPNVGVCAVLFTQKIPIDESDFMMSPVIVSQNLEVITETFPWSVEGMHAGLYVSLPLDTQNKYCLDIKAMVGASFVEIPRIRTTVVYTSVNQVMYSSDISAYASATAISFMLDFCGRVKLSHSSALILGANYISTTQEFKLPSLFPGDDGKYRQPVSTLSLYSGIVYLLR